MTAISRKIPPPPTRAAALFFNTSLGGYTPGLVMSKKHLNAPIKRIALKIKKMVIIIFIVQVPLYSFKNSTNCCNYLYVYPSIPMNMVSWFNTGDQLKL
jgi:hypothetical protein